MHELAAHMKHLGLTMLAHAVHHSIFISFENPYYNAIGVLHAAQAAEVILKACIAEEHPLLIFARLPKPENDDEAPLGLGALMTQGRTIQYAELPDVFWAATGFRVPSLKTYRKFGELRNTIQHLAVPRDDLSSHTLEFLLNVIDPLIQEFWATSIFQHLQVDEEAEFRGRARTSWHRLSRVETNETCALGYSESTLALQTLGTLRNERADLGRQASSGRSQNSQSARLRVALEERNRGNRVDLGLANDLPIDAGASSTWRLRPRGCDQGASASADCVAVLR